jgi:hypothetical protein
MPKLMMRSPHVKLLGRNTANVCNGWEADVQLTSEGVLSGSRQPQLRLRELGVGTLGPHLGA